MPPPLAAPATNGDSKGKFGKKGGNGYGGKKGGKGFNDYGHGVGGGHSDLDRFGGFSI